LDLHRLLDLHERFAQVVLDQFKQLCGGRESCRSVTSSPDGIRRVTGSAATVPANTTTLTVVNVR